jgi:hypothetical protein
LGGALELQSTEGQTKEDEERGGGTEVRGAGMICISEADVVVCIHKLDKRMDKIKGN